MIHKEARSPWGKIQSVRHITPWLTLVTTASHGGFKLDRSHNSAIPEYLRTKGGWYEEDCEWSIVFSILESLIKKECFDFSKELVFRLTESKFHESVFKIWYPKKYEMYYGKAVA